jgi:hypothetical protein
MNSNSMVPNLQNCRHLALLVGLFLLASVCGTRAQRCYTGSEIDASTAKAVETAARLYFNMSAHGDVAGLRANAIPEVAANFGNIEQAVVANKPFFAQGQPSDVPTFVLDASESKTTLQRADFYCGIYNSPARVGFSIPNLPPGRYAVSIAKVPGKDPITLTMILQDAGNNVWKLAGYYARRNSIGEHDGPWYLSKAREYKEKGHLHNAWFYYLTAWDLIAPANFMGTPQLDKLGDEMQAARPGDLPGPNAPLALSAGGKTFKVTDLAPVPAGSDLDLQIQYETADAANATLASQDNAAVMKAMLTKYPELRDAFNAMIARATDSLGHDYGTITQMKDVK